MEPLKVECETVEQWKSWLRRNHNKETKVILIRYRKPTGKKSFNQHAAMRVAICFGWIDTTLRGIDNERYGVTFVKRNKNSRWSNNTLRYARELIDEGKMSPFGLEKYREGLKKKTIDHGLPRDPDVPDELRKVLKKKGLLTKFEKSAPSKKRYWIWGIMRAVRDETKNKRIKIVVDELSEKV